MRPLPSRTRSRNPGLRFYRPRLEALEDRLTPTTLAPRFTQPWGGNLNDTTRTGSMTYVGIPTADPQGDLFYQTYTYGYTSQMFGLTVAAFELPAGSAAAKLLYKSAPFISVDGTQTVPPALVVDSQGNLFGTTAGDGPFNHGSLFELQKTGQAYTYKRLFAFGDEARPDVGYRPGNLLLVNDVIYGTCAGGGKPESGDALAGQGTVWSAPAGSTSPTRLAALGGDNGSYPNSPRLTLSGGKLYGTTKQGGDLGYGTVFSVSVTNGFITPLGSLGKFQGVTGPVAVSNGYVFGTTFGVDNGGSVFKVSTTPGGSLLTKGLPANVGHTPFSGLVTVGANIIGSNQSAGTSGYGCVFLINQGFTAAATSAAAQPLNQFGGNLGYSPYGLSVDGVGNVYGVTLFGSGNTRKSIFWKLSGLTVPHMAFGSSPANGQPGMVLTAVRVTVTNAAPGSTVTVALASNPTHANLGGTRTRPVVNGVATFNDLSISLPGIGYTLQATSGELSATSVVFTVGTDVVTNFATETNGTQLAVTYEIRGSLPEKSFHLALYRSATNVFTPADVTNQPNAKTVEIDSHLLLTGADLKLGTHRKTITIVGDGLSIDPSHPYVLAVADPEHVLNEIRTDNNQAHFRKYVVAGVVHGFIETNTQGTGTPEWETQMVDSLKAQAYDVVFPWNWAALSATIAPNQTVLAGKGMYGELLNQILNDLPGTFGIHDVIDIHMIGHSRGTVVISQVLINLEHRSGFGAGLRLGYVKMTMLDPHPDKPVVQSSDSNDGLGNNAVLVTTFFQQHAPDPDVVVPAIVNQAEVFYQHTAVSKMTDKNDFAERTLNLWGQVPVKLEPKPAPITVHYYDLTNVSMPSGALVGHTEVHDWYQTFVVPTLHNATAFPFTPTRQNKADIAITTSTNVSSPVQVGSLLRYTITITNAGPATALGVGVQDVWDSSVKVISATATGVNGLRQPVRFTSTSVIFNVGNLAVDASVTLTITVRVPSKPMQIKNSAKVDSLNPPGSSLPGLAAIDDVITDVVAS